MKRGLPWGSKPRLILTHLNSEALRHGSPEVEVEDSLTAFVQRIRGFGPGGREIRMFKDQLGRLSASLVRLALNVAGVSGKPPHSARHAMGKRIMQKTGNVAAVQRQLGHKNVSYALQYARPSFSEMEAAINEE